MIVIFASRFDKKASSLAERWKQYDASLLTCDDLSVSGWRHFFNDERTNFAVVNGRVVKASDIDGVLIRWPGVFAPELIQIAAHDRDYVASEMVAFLVSWFTSLNCPVINKPTPVNLTGPAWRLEQWTYAAAQLGIPVKPARRHVAREVSTETPTEAATATVTVVGDRCFGNVEPLLLDQSLQLARAAGVSLLEVGFSGHEAGSLLTGVNLIPKLNDETTDAVLDLLIRRESSAP